MIKFSVKYSLLLNAPSSKKVRKKSHNKQHIKPLILPFQLRGKYRKNNKYLNIK